jgi:hypothetical protein
MKIGQQSSFFVYLQRRINIMQPIVETERIEFSSMKDTNHLNYSVSVHMETIKEWLEGEKIMKFFSTLSQYSVKYNGVSFMNNKTMAKLLDVSDRTIRRYTQQLEELNIIIKIPTRRKRNNGQTSNTIIIVPILPFAKEMENKKEDNEMDKNVDEYGFQRGCPRGNPTNKHSFKPLKQERHYYKANQEKSENPPEEKINQYIANRVKDAIKKGTTIQCVSAYIDKVFRSLERKALAAAEILKNKKRQEENKRRQDLFREGFWGASAPSDGLRKPTAGSWQASAAKGELDALGVY